MRQIFGGATDDGGYVQMVFAVDDRGDLRWYRRSGQGEPDPTGARGWAPRSGNVTAHVAQ